ncbi:hypothetical protein BHM03_00022932 [Ensete ventricosum]|nr:hypothetical protein BHM03_00022932 [Ensete ventricosum]
MLRPGVTREWVDEELLGEHRGVETSGRKGRGSDDEPRGAQLPKKLSVDQNEGGLGGVPQCCRSGSTDREERDVDARQQIVMSWDFCGVIDTLLSRRESVGHERDRGGGECRRKLLSTRTMLKGRGQGTS